MGTQDLPAMIDYVLANTSQKSLHYVGHSMGATIAYVMLSLKPKYNAKVKLIVSLAPVTLWRHQLNPIQSFFNQVGLPLQVNYQRYRVTRIAFFHLLFFWCRKHSSVMMFMRFCHRLRYWHIKPINGAAKMRFRTLPASIWYLVSSARIANSWTLWVLYWCNFIFSFSIFCTVQTMLPYLFSYFPAGTSLRTLVHYHQNMQSGNTMYLRTGHRDLVPRTYCIFGDRWISRIRF